MKTEKKKNYHKFFVFPFQHCIALVQLKCIISYRIWIVRVSFYFLGNWIFHFETRFASLILKKKSFLFRCQCGQQEQNNIWGLTSVCSMLTESYSASAPKARRKRKKWTTGIPETTPNSHKPTTWRFEDYRKFPKPPSSGGAAPETYQYRTGREKGMDKSRKRVQPAEVGILPQGFLRPQEQILWHGKDLPGLRWNHERSSRWKSVIMILS